jgi:hypothetical protein
VPVLQTAPTHEFGEQAMGGNRDPMPSLLEAVTQTGKRRDIAVRPRRHNQNTDRIPYPTDRSSVTFAVTSSTSSSL